MTYLIDNGDDELLAMVALTRRISATSSSSSMVAGCSLDANANANDDEEEGEEDNNKDEVARWPTEFAGDKELPLSTLLLNAGIG